jgi:hypothetical protein
MSKGMQENDWRIKIEECSKSGMPHTKWCRENNINYKTFAGWKTKLKKNAKVKEPSSNWILVKPEEPKAIVKNEAIKITIGKSIIETTLNFDENHFEKIARILMKL